MTRPASLICLLSDFGLDDWYVGVMRLVLARHAPEARLIDVSHGVPPGDVRAGGLYLAQAVAAGDEGTVHLAVVDPGVGSQRRLLVVGVDGQWVVCPDNGLVSDAWRRSSRRSAWEIVWRPAQASHTFHGRDIFAPVAGHLSRGLDPARLGPEVDTLVRIAPPAPRVTREGVIRGEVVRVDHFGNLITNIPGDSLAQVGGKLEIRVGRSVLRNLCRSYGEAPKGKLIAVIGSTGHLEISVNQGNAQKKTGARVGATVRIHHAQP